MSDNTPVTFYDATTKAVVFVDNSGTNSLPVNASVTLSPTALQNVNITQVSSAAVAVGHGVAATALRVELPTDGTGVVGLAAGAANIGTVAVSGGGLTGTVTIAAGAATIGALVANQSINLGQVAGATVATGHGTAAGAVRVELPTDGTGQVSIAAGATVAATGTVTALSGTAANFLANTGGLAAQGAAVSGNPIRNGARGSTADPTAVTDGQVVDILTDSIGRIINRPYALEQNTLRGFITSTATTAATLLASPGGALFNYITSLELGNTSTTQAVITLNDSASTQLIVPASGGNNVKFDPPIKTTTTATATTFTTTPAVTTILAAVQGYKAI